MRDRFGVTGRVMWAEWTKFRTVRSSFWTLVVAVAVTIGAGVWFLQAEIDAYAGLPDQVASHAIRAGWWFGGMQSASWP